MPNEHKAPFPLPSATPPAPLLGPRPSSSPALTGLSTTHLQRSCTGAILCPQTELPLKFGVSGTTFGHDDWRTQTRYSEKIHHWLLHIQKKTSTTSLGPLKCQTCDTSWCSPIGTSQEQTDPVLHISLCGCEKAFFKSVMLNNTKIKHSAVVETKWTKLSALLHRRSLLLDHRWSSGGFLLASYSLRPKTLKLYGWWGGRPTGLVVQM